ncbi:MAG: hypothetical protein AAB421_02010 [Patescibacteria group bacterium]
MRLSTIEKKIASAEANLAELRLLRVAVIQKKRVRCEACLKTAALRSWSLIIEHHHISPYGCSSGDYWARSKGREWIRCPHCRMAHKSLQQPFLDTSYFDTVFTRYKSSGSSASWYVYKQNGLLIDGDLQKAQDEIDAEEKQIQVSTERFLKDFQKRGRPIFS